VRNYLFSALPTLTWCLSSNLDAFIVQRGGYCVEPRTDPAAALSGSPLPPSSATHLLFSSHPSQSSPIGPRKLLPRSTSRGAENLGTENAISGKGLRLPRHPATFPLFLRFLWLPQTTVGSNMYDTIESRE